MADAVIEGRTKYKEEHGEEASKGEGGEYAEAVEDEKSLLGAATLAKIASGELEFGAEDEESEGEEEHSAEPDQHQEGADEA
jgi:hypothetical protein